MDVIYTLKRIKKNIYSKNLGERIVNIQLMILEMRYLNTQSYLNLELNHPIYILI